jgi:hypothetical protein
VSTDGKKRRRARASPPRDGAPPRTPERGEADALPRWANAGVGFLFVAACAFGVLEVHYSTDTWIGLAAGRQILTEPTFPKADTFSYPFHGQTWFNQNWLSHVFFWILYDKLGPNAVVIGTWMVSAGIFTLVLLATWFRCGSWLAAFLAASIVAIASRDWLSIRPATIQFLLLAAAWLGFAALAGQGTRCRWWPMALLLATYGVWPHAHGSFLLGFGLLGLFLGCVVIARLAGLRWRVGPGLGDGQVLALAGVGLLTAVLGALLSPYGFENFTHPLKVVESDVFRTVGEWVPPYRSARFPGVLRFWIALAIAAATLLTFLGLRAWHGWRARPAPRKARPAAPTRPVVYAASSLVGQPEGWPLHAADRPVGDDSPAARAGSPRLNAVLFDIAAVGIGLYMAMFARRFAPLFYILATPALVTWIMALARPLPARLRRLGRKTVIMGAWVGAAVSIVVTARLAYRELVRDVMPGGPYSLLDRVTHNDHTPLAAIEFLSRNGLTPNVMTEWKVAASIMFYVPGARVFIDGRAQQVYTEQHYMTYMGLLNLRESQGAVATHVLDQHGTDLVLLPKWEVVRRLLDALQGQPEWRLVLEEPAAAIWVREESALLDELIARERAGTLWWPDTPETEWRRGMFLTSIQPEEPQRAIAQWQSAVARQPAMGLRAYYWIVTTLLQDGRGDEAEAYLRAEQARIEDPQSNLSPALRQQLLAEIRRCRTLLPGQGGVPDSGPGPQQSEEPAVVDP